MGQEGRVIVIFSVLLFYCSMQISISAENLNLLKVRQSMMKIFDLE
jgi:hypothetical protein